MRSHSRRQPPRMIFFDALYIGILILYALGGVVAAPFHGDESTTIYMSHDWYTLTQAHDLAAVLYSPLRTAGRERDDQVLRLLNGVVSKYSIGLMWSAAGMSVSEINGPWSWGDDWWVNRYYKQFPSDQLLFLSRMTSALMLALSVAVVFAIGRRLSGNGAARLMALVYATMPGTLLNGRRAMYEGALLLATALVIWAGLEVARRYKNYEKYERPKAVRGLVLAQVGLGIVAGLAVASKHTCLLTIAAVVPGLLWVGRRRFLRTLGLNALSGVLAFGVFFALNPAWWGDPLYMPGVVLSLRQEMMGTQETFYGLSTMGERVLALVQYPFGSPQFFEDAKYDWTQWIGSQIAAYNSSGLAGVEWSRWIGFVWAALLTGCVLLVRRPAPMNLVFLCVLGVSAAGLLVTNRLPWQRYYLPLAAPLAVTVGLGFYGWWRLFRYGFKRLQAPGQS